MLLNSESEIESQCKPQSDRSREKSFLASVPTTTFRMTCQNQFSKRIIKCRGGLETFIKCTTVPVTEHVHAPANNAECCPLLIVSIMKGKVGV